MISSPITNEIIILSMYDQNREFEKQHYAFVFLVTNMFKWSVEINIC